MLPLSQQERQSFSDMKLHLPKALLSMVLAVCAAQTVQADWGVDKYSNTSNGEIVYYTTSDATVVDKFNPSAGREIATSCTDIRIAPETNQQEHVFTNVYIADGDKLSVIRNPWGPSDGATVRDFKLLTIENLIVGDGLGAATLVVDANQGLKLNALNGAINKLTVNGSMTMGFDYTFSSASQVTGSGTGTLVIGSNRSVDIKNLSGNFKELKVDANGSLSVGTAGVSETISVSNKISVGAGGTLTVAGGTLILTATDDKTLTASNAEIVVNKGAVLQLADGDTVDYGASNMKITLKGGELSLGNKRQTLAGIILTLEDGKVTSTGYGDGYGALDIFNANTVIKSSGNSSITGGVRLRATGNFNIIDGTLTVDSIFKNGGIVKSGDGTLKLTSMASNSQSEAFYTGNTEMKGGAIEYALTSSGTYSGTIFGTGNIVNSGSGTVTLNKVSNLDGDITVSAGVLNITSLAANKTMGVSVAEGAELNIGSLSLNLVYGDLQLDAVSATYADNIEGASSVNGFRTGEVVLRLFDGYEWNGSIEGYAVSTQNGDTLVTTNVNGSTFYVNEGTHKISANSEYINGKAQGYGVAKDANLVIDGASGSLTAAQILTGAIGDGNITVGTNITLTNNAATQVTGKLTVKDAALTLGEGDAYKNNDFNLSSFSSIDLTDATVQASLNNFTGAITISRTKDDGQSWLRVNASQDLQFKDITLGGGARLEIYNKGGARTTVIDKLTVDESGVIGTFRDGSCHQGTTNINSLNIVGTTAELTLKNGSKTTNTTNFNLSGDSTFKGTINLESDSQQGASRHLQVNLNSIGVAQNAVINFQDPTTADGDMKKSDNNITLGVGVEGVKVAGLSGETTNAATIKATAGTKSLEIIAAADKTYETNAKVESSVNLVKRGKGTQIITGAVDAKSITVNDGELQLSGAVGGNSAVESITLAGGKLELSNTVATGGIEINGGELALKGAGAMNLGTVEVLSGALNIGSAVTLTADIKLTTGSELSLNGYESAAATIHGTVELGKGLELSGTVVDAIYDLKAGEKLLLLHADNVIFGDVNEAAHGEYANLAMAADAMIEATPLLESIVDVGTYFSSLNVEDYKLLFENGALYIQASNPIPEPTTATLSLLALAALASRRRRK